MKNDPRVHKPSAIVPDLWSAEMIKRFKEQSTLDKIKQSAFVVLRIGEATFSMQQLLDAIDSKGMNGVSDPIVRDALIAFVAKQRITKGSRASRSRWEPCCAGRRGISR